MSNTKKKEKFKKKSNIVKSIHSSYLSESKNENRYFKPKLKSKTIKTYILNQNRNR